MRQLGGAVKRQCAESQACRQMPCLAVPRPGGYNRVPGLATTARTNQENAMGESSLGTPPPVRPVADRLDSWKEIAAYLKRDVTTVQRWEKREGMPVHRHVHDRMGSVYAFSSELDAWVQSRRPGLEEEEKKEDRAEPSADERIEVPPTRTSRARLWLVLSGVGVLALIAVAF